MGNKWAKENPERAKELVHKHYLANKPKWKERKKANQKKIRDLLRAAKDVPCMDCGVRYPYYVMDLDHRDPSTKESEPSRMINGFSLKRAKEEIAKCDAVCSNCHRIRTFTRPKVP